MAASSGFFRSPAVKPVTLLDRLGGGDTWNAGSYYGLLTEGASQRGLQKGVLVGGPDLVKAILAPLPQLEIVPVGGVDLSTAAEFDRKGVAALIAEVQKGRVQLR